MCFWTMVAGRRWCQSSQMVCEHPVLATESGALSATLALALSLVLPSDEGRSCETAASVLLDQNRSLSVFISIYLWLTHLHMYKHRLCVWAVFSKHSPWPWGSHLNILSCLGWKRLVVHDLFRISMHSWSKEGKFLTSICRVVHAWKNESHLLFSC